MLLVVRCCKSRKDFTILIFSEQLLFGENGDVEGIELISRLETSLLAICNV